MLFRSTNKTVVLPTVITATATQITTNSAVVGGNITDDGNADVTERGVVYSISHNPTTSDTKLSNGSGIGSFTCDLTGLQANTTYYVRAYAINSKGVAYGEQVSFTTKSTSYSDPTGTENGHGYVDLGLSVKWATCNVGANKPEDYGDYFAWGETEPKTSYDWWTYKWCNGSETTLTKYNTNSDYGIVDNKTILELSDDAAHVNWGGDWRIPTRAEQDELHEQCTWTWTTQNGVNGYNVTSNKNGNSIFLPATGWRSYDNSFYAGYVGRYWSSSLSIDYPQSAHVIYLDPSGGDWNEGRSIGLAVRPVHGKCVPTVVTSAVTQITETTAVVGGNVTNDGGAAVTERGICVATVSNPTTSNAKVTAGSGTGSFTCNLTGLQANTTYYVRAYAVNSKGTSYGVEVSFTTNKTVVLPTVTTSTITKFTQTTAVAGGNVTSDGNGTVTERGVCISTMPDPTIANTKFTEGYGKGSFTHVVTGLQANTTYYVRAYAVNSKGTAYGEEVSFTTASGAPAVLEYVDLGLSVKWATFNVGASKPEDYGDYFAWGETEPKTTYDWWTYKWCNGSATTLTKYNTNSGDGIVDNKTILELSDDAAHVNWGGNWRMPTDAEFHELREQCTWTWTTQNGVDGCNVTSKKNGNSIFLPAAGARYDSSLYNAGYYGVYWLSLLNTGGTSDAYCLYFDSSSESWYHDYRYSGRSVRPVYGLPVVTIPTVTTSVVTQITKSSAVAGGNVTSNGVATVTERGVCVATVSNPTTSNAKVTAGSGTGSFTCDLTGLQANTTYYVRAYAVNSKGTAYGEEVSFTTASAAPAVLEYVDLGLSVKWATCNVGASKPENYGDYFAWGETEPKDVYDWSTYKWCNGSATTLTKYNTNSGDGITILELSDDAAHINWGGNWRMPTEAEFYELLEQCTWTWTTKNGVNGHNVTSKKNGNSIFLPAAGNRSGSSLGNTGSYGYYWSNSLSFDPSYAGCLRFLTSSVGWGDYRYNGLSVRPVCQ